MATPIRTDWMNGELKPAPGTEDRVGVLPVHIDAANNTTTSVWQFTDQELASVVATKCVAAQVMGGHPPLVLTPLTIEPPHELRLSVSAGNHMTPTGQISHKPVTLSDALWLVVQQLKAGADFVIISRA